MQNIENVSPIHEANTLVLNLFLMSVVVTTKMRKSEGSFKARFVGVSSYPNKVGTKVDSPTYELEGHSWYISVFPGGYDTQCKGYVSCLLYIKPSVTSIRAHFSLSIFNSNGHKRNLNQSQEIIEFKSDAPAWGFDKFVSWEDINYPTSTFCVNDTLTVLAEITVYSLNEEYKQVGTPIPYSETIMSDLTNLLSDGTATDMTVIAPSSDCSTENSIAKRKHDVLDSEVEPGQNLERIRAHKLILSMRSPVFRTMFTSGMAEALTNEVRIQDFNAAVVKEFLRFLYTDQCEVDKHAEQLLSMACKYHVPGLQTLCANHLCATLSTKNVGNILYLSDLYDTTPLQQRVLCYIADHPKDAVKANLAVHELSPELTQKVLRALAGVTVSGDIAVREG